MGVAYALHLHFVLDGFGDKHRGVADDEMSVECRRDRT